MVPLQLIKLHLTQFHILEKFLCPKCGKDTKYKKNLVVSLKDVILGKFCISPLGTKIDPQGEDNLWFLRVPNVFNPRDKRRVENSFLVGQISPPGAKALSLGGKIKVMYLGLGKKFLTCGYSKCPGKKILHLYEAACQSRKTPFNILYILETSF
jgi:hypothetical protein